MSNMTDLTDMKDMTDMKYMTGMTDTIDMIDMIYMIDMADIITEYICYEVAKSIISGNTISTVSFFSDKNTFELSGQLNFLCFDHVMNID